MNPLHLPQQRHPSAFRDDEPIIRGRSLLPGACVPLFGDVRMWDFNGVLKRPANLATAGWKVCFTGELEDPYWNLLVREAMMACFQPTHPAVLQKGISLTSAADVRTVVGMCSNLRTLARWAIENGLPARPDAWTQDDLRYRIRALHESGSGSLTSPISTLKRMAAVEPILSLPWPAGDPWPEDSARAVERRLQKGAVKGPDEVSTPVVGPETSVSSNPRGLGLHPLLRPRHLARRPAMA